MALETTQVRSNAADFLKSTPVDQEFRMRAGNKHDDFDQMVQSHLKSRPSSSSEKSEKASRTTQPQRREKTENTDKNEATRESKKKEEVSEDEKRELSEDEKNEVSDSERKTEARREEEKPEEADASADLNESENSNQTSLKSLRLTPEQFQIEISALEIKSVSPSFQDLELPSDSNKLLELTDQEIGIESPKHERFFRMDSKDDKPSQISSSEIFANSSEISNLHTQTPDTIQQKTSALTDLIQKTDGKQVLDPVRPWNLQEGTAFQSNKNSLEELHLSFPGRGMEKRRAGLNEIPTLPSTFNPRAEGLQGAQKESLGISRSSESGWTALTADQIQSLNQQVLEGLQSLKTKDGSVVEIQLSPPEWGRIHVQLSMGKEDVKLSMMVENEAVKKNLEQSASEIKHILSQQGLGGAQVHVGLNQNPTRDSGSQDREERENSDRLARVAASSRKQAPAVDPRSRWQDWRSSVVDRRI